MAAMATVVQVLVQVQGITALDTWLKWVRTLVIALPIAWADAKRAKATSKKGIHVFMYRYTAVSISSTSTEVHITCYSCLRFSNPCNCAQKYMHKTVLNLAWTHPTQLTTRRRRGMRVEYRQPYPTQAEVTCTHSHFTLTPTSWLSPDH